MAYGTFMPNTNGYGYGNQYFAQPMQPMSMPMQNVQQPQMQTMQRLPELQGKIVDNIEVVKAMDIPLNGSVSYFPIADGTAIVTKQLMMDGTSKTIIYKPMKESEETEVKPQYLTLDEFNEKLKDINNNSVKDDIKNIKRQIKDIIEDIKEINEDRKD